MISETIFALAFVFGAFGLAFIVGHSKISEAFRSVIFEVGYTRRLRSPRPDDGGVPTGFVTAPTVPWSNRPGLLAWVCRWFVALIECPGCFGFWTGLIFGWFRFDLPASHAIALGVVIAGTNTFLGLFSGLIERE
jgi:hypothetical protein